MHVITQANSTDIISRAHTAGRKVLISIGGGDTARGFQGATTSANLPRFITNIVSLMSSRGYDGVDIDWEPLQSVDAVQFGN